MRKILFECNSPMNIMNTVKLRRTVYRDYGVIYLVTDWMNNYEKVVEQWKEIEKKDEIITVKIRNIYRKYGMKNSFLNKIRIFIAYWIAFKKALGNRTCDVIAFCSSNFHSCVLYALLNKGKDPQIESVLFEDSDVQYGREFGDRFQKFKQMSNSKGRWKKYINKAFYNVKKIYFHRPEFCEWDIKGIEKCQITREIDDEIKNYFNRLFNYEGGKDAYEQKYIFFEGAFYGVDGEDIGEVQVVEEIARVVGKENIFVKIHPRNLDNRFKQLGYQTSQNISIPFELICLNIDMSQKVLITFLSNAILMPKLTYDLPVQGIYLGEYGDKCKDMYENFIVLAKRMSSYFPDFYRWVHTKEELVETLTAKE